jgi:hypothetical protein
VPFTVLESVCYVSAIGHDRHSAPSDDDKNDAVKIITRVLQKCYKNVTRVLQECYKSITRDLQELHESVPSVSRKVLPWKGARDVRGRSGRGLARVVTLFLHCCYAILTLLYHCWHTAVTLLSHSCYTVVTVFSHCCYTVVALLLHCLTVERCKRCARKEWASSVSIFS